MRTSNAGMYLQIQLKREPLFSKSLNGVLDLTLTGPSWVPGSSLNQFHGQGDGILQSLEMKVVCPPWHWDQHQPHPKCVEGEQGVVPLQRKFRLLFTESSECGSDKNGKCPKSSCQ